MPRSPLLTRLPHAALTLVVALAACDRSAITDPVAPTAQQALATMPTQTVIASGLWYPRGFTFGERGTIYVAEAGVPQGNTISTVGQCQQVPDPIGPNLGGATGRISRIEMNGTRTTITSGVASAVDAMGDVTGLADLAFMNGKLYALLGAGCSHGHKNDPSAILWIRPDGTRPRVVNLSAWIKSHPTANPEPDDFEPDGSWYSMVAQGSTLYVTEANQGNLLAISGNPMQVTRLADVSATEGHVVPTALLLHNNDIVVGELTPFPAVPGGSSLLRYGIAGQLRGRTPGFTAVLGFALDGQGNQYVLESFTCPDANPCFPSPGSGDVVKIAHDGTRSVIATGLSFATALRLGPDGNLYVANFGYGPPMQGQIIRIALH